MNINIENLGAVKNASIEIKPLTVFVGPNGTGKTWTAYALSAIFGPYGWKNYYKKYARNETHTKYPVLDSAIDQLLTNGNAKINCLDFADQYAEIYFNEIALCAKEWIGEYLDTQQAIFTDLKMEVRLNSTIETIHKHITALQLEKKLSAAPKKTEALINCIKEVGDVNLYFYTSTESQLLDELPRRVVREFIAANAFEVIQRGLFPSVYIFPTERTAFITMSKIFFSERIGRDDEDNNNEKPVRSLGNPLGNILNLIRMAFLFNPSLRQREIEATPAIASIVALANLLESGVLNGQVGFIESGSGAPRQLVFQPAENVSLEMQVSSSMARELASILLCLRYFAEPNELLIIDEPEMNLHPEAQVKFMEILTMLVNAGMQIMITTHSSYMIDHLMNLMKAAEQADPDSITGQFFLKDKRAFIDKEKVGVYLFDNGTTSSILDDEGLINWDTFANVTDKTERIFFEISK